MMTFLSFITFFAAGVFLGIMAGIQLAHVRRPITTGYMIVRRDYLGKAIPVGNDGAFVISQDCRHAAEVAEKYSYSAEVAFVTVIEEN